MLFYVWGTHKLTTLTGGSGTMSKTLSFCLLYMLQYPECQEQIRLEIISIQQHSYRCYNLSTQLSVDWCLMFS